MVRNQITKRGVRNDRVVAALLTVPRHLFVDEGMKGQSYSDNALPLCQGQTISQPYIVAAMTELLQITDTDKILEIGTGSGYQAAVLAQLADRVFSIERIPDLAELGAKNLESAGITNVKVRCSDGTLGWPEEAPFDKIIVTAGAPGVPQTLFNQLKEGGLMVAPVGNRTVQNLVIVEKVNGQQVIRHSADCVFVPLIGEHGWKS